MTKLITCASCGEVKLHEGHGLCKNCYQRQYCKDNREKTRAIARKSSYKYGKKPLLESKSCGVYLGVVVAEQVLSKVFKDVEVMPYGNPGYDFICGKGYKVDSKAACERKDNSWLFHIRKNTIADYFALLTFDNKNDINPQHFWLIPGKDVNDKTTISISKSKLSKWDKYKQDIDKVIKCCSIMKSPEIAAKELRNIKEL